ncbi:MarR family transcriptional regulator [Nocardia sp. NPDC051750]|uniref:MarR family transcriptional regulator n=1 Tax=Nocardia sp. NPDC051750 TaxID=3364325 RepID=UPI0037B7B761
MSRSELAQSLTVRETHVLRALLPGSQLTVEQIARATCLSKHTVRRAVRILHSAGLLIDGVGLRRAAWQVSPLSLGLVATPRGRTALDVRTDRPTS